MVSCLLFQNFVWQIVWQKLEEETTDFFRAYYIRLKLKKQIILFNHLLEHQYHLTKYLVPPKLPVAPIHNGIHPMPVFVEGFKAARMYGGLQAFGEKPDLAFIRWS